MFTHRNAALALGVFLTITAHQAGAAGIEHVIHISVDGLRPDAVTTQGAALLPNFYRLRTQGAFTDNARTDVDFTVTLPNHTDQLTGRGVYGPTGASHNWTANSWSSGQTLAAKKGAYVPGVYDVAHDNGLRTGHYASKSKFGLFDTSWNATNGAPDVTGLDNGKDKVDVYLYNSNTSSMTNTWAANMAANPQQYSFIHYRDPDSAGHGNGWMSPTYLNSVQTVDGYLGQVFNLIDTNATFTDKTAIVLTTDHGGHGNGHGSLIPDDYVIPFYTWGPGVTAAAELYALNPLTRTDPGTSRPLWNDPNQPIRNGDAANLALDLLGLGPIPGSAINASQDLSLSAPCDFEPDGDCDINDIGALTLVGNLVAGVAVPPADAKFDLSNDNVVNTVDLDQWLTDAATTNGYATPYRRGDSDLDRDVDITDFGDVATQFDAGGVNPGNQWRHGDFDGDNDVDITDFNVLASNFAPGGYDGEAAAVAADADPGQVDLLAFYDTGEVYLIGNAALISGLQIFSASGSLLAQDTTPELLQFVISTNTTTYAEGAFVNTPVDGAILLGVLYDVNLDARDLTFEYTMIGQPTIQGRVLYDFVPEPASLLILGVGGLLVLRRGAA